MRQGELREIPDPRIDRPEAEHHSPIAAPRDEGLPTGRSQVAGCDGQARIRDAIGSKIGDTPHLNTAKWRHRLEDEERHPSVGFEVRQLAVAGGDHHLEGVIRGPSVPDRREVDAAVRPVDGQRSGGRRLEQRQDLVEAEPGHGREDTPCYHRATDEREHP
jgi:hypothetical protein